MNDFFSNKILVTKFLIFCVLVLLCTHLIYYHTRISKPNHAEEGETKDPPTIGVTEEKLRVCNPLDASADSLLTYAYAIEPSWIKTQRIQFENLHYLRKTVQMPKGFAATLFNVDFTNLVESQGLQVLNVREKMKSGDLYFDIGRGNVIYAVLEMVANYKIQPQGKEIFFFVNDMGKVYDETTKGFIELPENLCFVVPKNREFTQVITEQAEQAGKKVFTILPWSRNTFIFDAESDNAKAIGKAIHETLYLAPNRSLFVCSEKPGTLQALKDELNKLVKKGYRVRYYR